MHFCHCIQGEDEIIITDKPLSGSQDENITGDISIIFGNAFITDVVDFLPDMHRIDS